jgi:hypothetical protein
VARRARRHGYLHRRDPQRAQAVPQGEPLGLSAAATAGRREKLHHRGSCSSGSRWPEM